MNGKPKNAWDMYQSAETYANSLEFLHIIGNDSYKMGYFYYSMKAYESLLKIDTDNDY